MPSSSSVIGSGAGWRTPAVVVVCGCLIALLTFGIRASFGLFTAPISAAHGWGREVFALAIAIQNLLWGAGQPFAGALADRFGSARVLAAGSLLYAAGVALMAVAGTPLAMHLSAGVLIGLGLAGASFTIVIAALARRVPPEQRSWATGIATASGSLGQFLMAPLGQAFILAYGWQTALFLLAAGVVVVPLLATAMASGPAQGTARGEVDLGFKRTLAHAFGHRSYQLLVAGFFVCGFHVAFITVHLPPYLTDAGVSPQLAAWSIAIIGLGNIMGSYVSGVLGGRFSKRWLLTGIYGLRALVIVLFVLLPVTPASVILFAVAMGLLWLSTVPPTSGLVAVMFGTRYMAMLFGIVFFSHQIGSFLGIWLGGLFYERYGSYDAVWWMGVALGLFAALVHMPIIEEPAPRFATAAA
ncbi:MFS transporter [Benzoatithermus flavus]|uniref:MFS transporter n=1 Tax=Benzoatithermus flavus TaxID=3108223 RepID=A0ABU8XUG5_9PROT